jgi:hypothetical protein
MPFPSGRGAVLRWFHWLACVAAVWAFVCGTRTSGAAELEQPVRTRLDWDSSLCGNAAGFSARVLKRSRRVRFVRADPQLTVVLRIEANGAGLNASVSLRAPGRDAVIRHIESPDCEDALDALALVVAISVEARSQEVNSRSKERPRRTSPRKRPRPPATAAPTRAASEAAAPQQPEPPIPPEQPSSSRLVDVLVPPDAASVVPAPVPPDPVPQAAVSPVATPTHPQPAGPIPTPASPGHEPLDLVGGVSAQALFGVAPDALVGGQLWLRAHWERDGIWSPALGLSYSHQRLDELVRDQGLADFALNVATLELCPLRLGGAVFSVGPCLLGSLGRLRSSGHETYVPGGETRPWGTLGASAQALARWSMLELRVSFGLLHPLVRDAFRFGPACTGAACERDVFHRVGAVLWSADAGLGLDFW